MEHIVKLHKRFILKKVLFYSYLSTRISFQLFSSFSVNAEEFIAEGDKVMIRFTMSGTQTQPFMGMPATGKPVKVTAMNIYQLQDGKIVREHGLPDIFTMLQQLGAIPVPAPQQ